MRRSNAPSRGAWGVVAALAALADQLSSCLVNFMASGRKQKAGRAKKAEGGSSRLEVNRLIAMERYKDAIKQAKLCYRDEATPEHHRLLERAYLLRAQQLHRGGMPSSAREVAYHLVEFGVTDPDLVGPAADLCVAVGMAGRAFELQQRLEDPDAKDRLIRRAADQAVLHPDRTSGEPPEIRDGASRVREALQALESGDEEGANRALKDVARASPFGEWKRFVRGLAAFRRRDSEESRASWDRLDPARAPARIANTLRALEAPEPGVEPVPALEAIERRAFGTPVLGPLRKLGPLVAQRHWGEVVKKLGPLRSTLRRIDPALAERLTEVLYFPLIESATRLGYEEARRLVRDFSGAAEPLPIDPRWNRLWALIWEGPQGDLDHAEPFWRKYLDDLATAPGLRDDERPTAKAIILTHLGRQLAGEASMLGSPGFFGASRVDAETRRLRKRAVDCLEEGLRLCPTHRATYQALIQAYREWEQPDEAAAVGRRLLEVFPDDFDTLMELAVHDFRRDDPARSLDYTQRARALRPLDTGAIGHECASLIALARQHALKRRFDEGRAALEEAERIDPEWGRSVHFLARKAVLELKAGRNDRADELIAEAQGLLVEPAPLWLALLIEGRRYKLSKPKREPFEARWTGSLSGKRRSETAGALAELLDPFVAGDVPYTGRDTHVRQVADYLRRTTRLKYRREDLARVCSFLSLLPHERKLFETLAKRGDRLFPDAPEFPMMLGGFEMEKGPFRADLTLAHRHFKRALGIAEAQAPTDPKAAALVPKIREAMTGLEDRSPFGPMPFGGPGSPLPGPSALPPEVIDLFGAIGGAMGIDPNDLIDMYEDEDEESFDDLIEDPGVPPLPFPLPFPMPLPAPAPRPRRPSPQKKKKKKKR